MTEQARAIRCSQCGASLKPDPDAGAYVVCAACGGVERIDRALLDELGAHNNAVGGALGQARGDVEAASYHALVRYLGWRHAAIVGAALLLGSLATIPDHPAGHALALALFFGAFYWIYRLMKREEERLCRAVPDARTDRPAMVCGSCGATYRPGPDEALTHCRHCGGTMFAGAAARERLRDAADDIAAQADIQRRHEEWRTAAHTCRDARTDLAPYFVFGFLIAIWDIGCLATTGRWLLGQEVELRELLLLDGLGLAMTIALVIPLLLRRRWTRRLHAALDGVAAPLNAARHSTPASLAEWLCRHWTGRFDPRRICGGRGYTCVLAEDPPVAVSVAPFAEKDGPARTHTRVIIALPPAVPLNRLVEEPIARGFDITAEEGGLVATADPGWHADAVDDPSGWSACGELIARMLAVTRPPEESTP